MKHRSDKFTLFSAITTLFCLSAATVKVAVKKRATRMAPMTYLKLIAITFIAGWAYWLCTVSTFSAIVNPISLFTDFKESDTDINDAYFDEDSKFIRVNAVQTFVNTVPVDANPNDFDTYQLNFSNYRLGYHMNRPMNKSFCDKASVLVMILTRPDAFNTRAAVRNSWLFNVSSEIAYHFIVGFTPDSTVRQNLKQENTKYGDIVFMDIVDDYNNLSLKTGALMQWQQKHCPNVNYLVKADDDIAVDLDRLLHHMRTDFDKTASVYNAAIFGLVWQRAEPNRDPESKWYVPHVAWRKKFYPDYCNGPMYVLTTTAVEGVLQALSKAHLMNIEDVLYTGIAAEIAGIARFNRRQIFGQGRSLDRYHACDSFGVPFVSSLYDFKLGSSYNPTMPNAISRAVDSLHSVQCE